MLAIPAGPSPARIRSAASDDVAELVRVRAASWRWAYRDILPADELEHASDRAVVERFVAASRDRSGAGPSLLVAERDAMVVGYAWFGPQRSRWLPYLGEVYELYLDPRFIGLGIGRTLFVSALWALVHRGSNPPLVWVLANNPSRHFYASCGGIEVARTPLRVGGARTTRIAYGWPDRLPVPR